MMMAQTKILKILKSFPIHKKPSLKMILTFDPQSRTRGWADCVKYSELFIINSNDL